MDETLRNDIPQVSEDENEGLTAPFSEEEVRLAVGKPNLINSFGK
jgi:hypothetical protein